MANHERLTRDWSTRLGRTIQLVAYEGGPHLDGRGAPYQEAFYAATNDPRMGDIARDYLRRLDAAGMELYVDFQFTGQSGAAPWGDFAKLHRMDQALATAHLYNAVVAAADGSLWGAVTTPAPAPLTPEVSIGHATLTEGRAGLRWMTFTGSLSAPGPRPVTVRWATVNGTAVAGRDFVRGAGTLRIPAGQTRAVIRVAVRGDRLREADETFSIVLYAPTNARLSATASRGFGTIIDDDAARVTAAFAAFGATSKTRR